MGFFELANLMPEWAVFAAVLAFVMGCCAGSFVNCLAWRIVHGESVLRGRSHCACCNHVLGTLDLVPVFSWLALRGRCRYCGEPISVRYTAAELICGAYFLSVLMAFGFVVQTPFLMVLGCVLLGLSLVDLDSLLIPNGFVLFGVVLWVAMMLASGALGAPIRDIVFDGLLAAVVLAGLVLLVSWGFKLATGKEGMGMGDVKLYFMVSLYLGLAAGVLNLFVSCIVGLAFAVRAGRRAFPFGPSIAVASWFTLLFGPGLVSAYLALL
ncbi:MAG: prepilin peptidase [Coriobacteriia bacterium]|nr:prepilin peptidase [Coriobacteriia bacterium]